MIGIVLAIFAGLGEVRSETALPQDSQYSVLKVYGAGGAGLEGYQTGVLIDTEGIVLTADSVAFEGGPVTLVDAFGDRFEADLLARDAVTGLALLECSADMTASAASIEGSAPPEPGTGVWVLSNAFNIAAGSEPVTVQRARIAAIAPIPLPAGERPRPGTPAVGQTVVLLDVVTSNPGAAGGLVIGDSGRVIGVLGAETRSPLIGSWINYAIPSGAVNDAIVRMRSGEANDSQAAAETDHPWRTALWRRGLSFVPTLDERTPPYIEAITPDSEAAAAGLLADDLVVAVNGVSVSEVEAAGRALANAVSSEGTRLTVLRGEQITTLEFARKETR